MWTALLFSLAVAATTATESPATFATGRIPTLSVTSVEVGGGEVLLEVSVDRTGVVSAIRPLRETATFTERMIASVKTWIFDPARAEIPRTRRRPGGPTLEPVESRVLVAGVFRNPAVIGATLGEAIRDVATASHAVPFPTSLVVPTYPPGTLSPGVVLVEVQIDAQGNVTDAKIRIGAAGYDSAALSTARQWKFRPATSTRSTVPSVAYLVFGFPTPRG